MEIDFGPCYKCGCIEKRGLECWSCLDTPVEGIKLLKGFSLLVIILLFWTGCAAAAQLSTYDHLVVRAIIGEAEGEPFEGKLAVACAIRNRKTLHGVYGVYAPRVIKKKFSQGVFDDALMAWRMSEATSLCVDLIQGAQYWEGDAFPKPKWSRNMKMTAHIGNQKFYRDPI